MSDELNNQTLGELLKQSRTALKLSIDDVSDRTRIPAKYLYWLEKGEYDKLPALVYAQGFLVKCSKIFNLDKKELIEKYLKEASEFSKVSPKNILIGLESGRNANLTKKSLMFTITPKVIAMCLSVLIVVGIVGYFGQQVYNLVRSPEIVIYNPPTDKVVTDHIQSLEGRILGANILTINGKTTNFNEDTGELKEIINLSEGLNVIELKAQNRMGKETILIRKIIYNKQ